MSMESTHTVSKRRTDLEMTKEMHVKYTPAVVPSILTAESLLQCAMLCLAVKCRRFAYERPRCGINIKSPDIGHSYWVDQKVKQVSVLKVTCL